MLDPSLIASFDKIYSTDLVYAKDCWKLCGNGHCCNFTRYKSQFTMIGKNHFQELPLLPNEYEYLQHKGWTAQFGEHEHRVVEYPIQQGRLQVEFMVGRSKTCACEHDTRTTVCRLYPLLPVFEIDGRMTGIDTDFGIFEEIERLDGLERACKIESVPFQEMSKFYDIIAEISRRPIAVFQVMAYRLARRHARDQLAAAKASRGTGAAALAVLEPAFLLRRLLDQSVLRPQIEALAAKFKDHYGDRFRLD